MAQVKLVSVEGNKLETDYQHALKIFQNQALSMVVCWHLDPNDKNYELNESGILTRRNQKPNKAAKESGDS